MNAKQLAALTERERVQVTHISTRTRPNTLVEMVQDFATALADARLALKDAVTVLMEHRDQAERWDLRERELETEVARLTEERAHWKANHDSQVAKKNSGAAKMKAHYEAEVARLNERLGIIQE